MKRNPFLVMMLVLFLITWTACGGGEADESSTTSSEQEEVSSGEPESMAEAMNKAGEALQQAMGGDEAVEPVDFRKLKDLLPEDLPGMERTNAEGQRSGMMGIKISQAEGDYESDAGRIKITILDMGTLKGAAMFGYAWLLAEIDKESDDGYERTTKFKGYPAYEKMDRSDEEEDYSFQVVVGERFIVSIEGSNVTKDQMEEARDRIDYGKLDGMKNEGT